MSDQESNYQHIYTGSEVNVQYLENLFEDAGIHSIRKNNFESGLRAGFGGGVRGQVQLLVNQAHLQKAKTIADSAFSGNQQEKK